MTAGLHLISGASGAGKSTLLAALAARGHSTVPEAGRAVILEQRASGGRALPWIDQAAYMEAILARNIVDHARATALVAPVFFDRGVPEVLAWARLLGIGVQPHHREAVARCRYAPVVFIAEPWPEIYVTDQERREDFARALRSYQPTLDAYVEAGYALRVLPRASVAERLRFVLAAIGEDG